MNQTDASAAPAIRVRRATPADREPLLAFYREHHAHRPRLTDPDVWDWLFAEQPRASDAIPFFVLEADGKVAGGIGYVVTRARLGDRDVDAIFPVNFFINPAYRGLPALRLLRAALKECSVAIAAYVSPDAMRLLLKSGFVDLSTRLRGYHYGLQADSSGLRSRSLALARRCWEQARRLWLAVVRPGLRHALSAELDQSFVDDLCPRVRIAGLRKDYAWLHWRYVKSPLLEARFVYQFCAGQPAALAIIHIDTARCELLILDVLWAGAASTALVGVLDTIIATARTNRCRTVATHALGDTLHRQLRLCLFASAQSNLGLLVFARDPAVRDALAEQGQWQLMLGDTDAY